MAKQESHFHGLLIVDKPGRPAIDPTALETTERLLTSHDVVQRVRRWSRQRRIGHTGTLDPLASGVLVLCLGQATRLVEYYQGHAKQYYAEIVLGRATDTYDALGQVTNTKPVPLLDPDKIETVLQQFRGEIDQMPPAYSAIKQGGESLHRKARRGEEVTLTPRQVNFYQLDFINYTSSDKQNESEARLTLRVRCSAGGYIRSLAHDLGIALDTYAHLDVLRREAAGSFELQEAHTLQEIEAVSQDGTLAMLLQPPGYGLQMPQIMIDEETERRLGHGQKVPFESDMSDGPTKDELAQDTLAQAIDREGQTLGIIRCIEKAAPDANVVGNRNVWKAEKWFSFK